MSKPIDSQLPPIAVADSAENISLSMPSRLRLEAEEFGKYFEDTAGQKPASADGVYIGILTAYLQAHSGFQKWKSTRVRVNGHATGVAPPPA